MPTGQNDSPAEQNQQNVPYGQGAKAGAVNISIRTIIETTGVPLRSTGVFVPQGATVRVRAHNGTTTGNSAPVRLGSYREMLLEESVGDVLTPDTEIIFPVDNLAQIWVTGTAGDGIIVSIRH